MPELPEVECIRRGLELSLAGKTVHRVEILRTESIGYPKPKAFIDSLIGQTFHSISRRGKYLIAYLNKGAHLVVHLRMSGRLLLIKDQKIPSRFLRVRIALDNGNELRFEDMRVFGRLWYVPPNKECEEIVPALATLGAEPLDGLNGKVLRELLKGKSQAVKTALLDQKLLAGVGNIYADESLFKAALHPQTQAGLVTPTQAARLVVEIQSVLSSAIAAGGSTLRDYTDSRGVNGKYQNEAWVYGRAGKPCRVCGAVIEKVKLAGRSSHFCPECQSETKTKSLVRGSFLQAKIGE